MPVAMAGQLPYAMFQVSQMFCEVSQADRERGSYKKG